MADYDLYDVLAELGYGLAPRTRAERAEAFAYKHAGWLAGLPAKTAATLRALAAAVRPRRHRGSGEPAGLPRARGGARRRACGALQALGEPADVLLETKARMFAA